MAIATLHEQRVTEQDMQNALRGAFLEGFKEGVSISQRSMFASTMLEHLLCTCPDLNYDEMASEAFRVADIVVAAGRPKKATNETVQTSQ